MNNFKEMDTLELQETQGGFDPVSWAIGFVVGSVVNGVVEAATGKSCGGWVAEGIKAVGEAYKTEDFRYAQPLYGNW